MTEKNEPSPIIVFDSGFGGISVLKKLAAAMPDEQLLYFGDTKNAPYGPRTRQEISRLTVQAISALLDAHPKGVVIACNTATAAAIEDVRALCKDIPVTGILPAVEEAAAECRRMIVLATQSTLDSPSYAEQLNALREKAEIISLAAPGLVSYVENRMRDREGALSYMKELLRPVSGQTVDGVVLGCTHFPFAADVIREALGYDAVFFDAADRCAREMRLALAKGRRLNPPGTGGNVTFQSSAPRPEVLAFANHLFAETD